MAEYPLIREYLLAIDPVIHNRPDAADLRDELSDHLIEAVERLRSRGVDSGAAERESLTRLGDPVVIAGLITAVPAKGSTMYTFFTRGASYFAFVAAAFWTAAAVVVPFSQDGVLVAWNQTAYVGATVLITAAIIASALGLLALHVYIAGRFDALAIVTSVILALSASSSFFIGWFFAVWLMLLVVATSMTLGRAWDNPVATGAPRMLLVILWPIASLVAIVGALGTIVAGVSSESLAIATFVAVSVPIVALIYAAGLLAVGVRMRALAVHRERPGPLMTA